ncbi:MAG TPA: hypothetical protein VEX86_23455 [Longimicrobium sp.]|nr:hypothetical protein [Longimicrobium sp.]
MRTKDVAELRALREAAKERSRQIAERLERIEAQRHRLWARMDRLRAEMDGRPRPAPPAEPAPATAATTAVDDSLAVPA